MPRKTYGRRYSRRKSYRKKSKFSKFNLYRKRGSKSQAMQIYSLNRRVTGLYKQVRQDIDTYISSPALSDIFSYDGSTQVSIKSVSYAILGSATFGDLSAPTSSTPTLTPDSVLIKNISLYVHFRFNGLADTTQPCYLRLVICRYKQNVANTLANTAIIPSSSDPILRVRGPLATGVKDSGFYVLNDYKFMMTSDRPTIDKKIRIRGCRLDKGELLYPKNSTFVVVCVYNPNYSNPVNHTEGHIYYKLAYTNSSFSKSVPSPA